MKFLADEDFPAASVKHLREAGYEVTSVATDSPGVKDTDILTRAVREERILLTFDRDFGELIYKLGLSVPKGVVYFRFDPMTPKEPAEMLLNMLKISNVKLENKFSVVERMQFRQRPLP